MVSIFVNRMLRPIYTGFSLCDPESVFGKNHCCIHSSANPKEYNKSCICQLAYCSRNPFLALLSVFVAWVLAS